MAMYGLPPPEPLDISGQQLHSKWKKFKQRWENYELAMGISTKPSPTRVATLLSVIGQEAVTVYNTFEWTTDGDDKKIDKSISNGGDQATSAGPLDHGLEAIIIDCSAFNFIDLMAARTLLSMVTDYQMIGVQVVLAQCTDSVQEMLSHGGFFEHVSQDHIYLTVHDAVVSLSNNTNQAFADETTQEGNSQQIQVERPAESEM